MNGLRIHARMMHDAFKVEVNGVFKPEGVTVILGGSGAGKSSLLRLIAGLDVPQDGLVTANGEVWSDTQKNIFLPPQKRSVGFMFQDYALFEHMTVGANIGYGLKGARAERKREANVWAERMHLCGLEDRLPDTLSGGQRQRVALARALAPNPKVLLMDEPFSAIDAHLKKTLLEDLRTTIQNVKRTTLMVTHNVDEARTLADTIGVMANGRLVRLGPTEDVLNDPQTFEAAQMTGWENLLPVAWASGNRLGGSWGATDINRPASLDAAWIGIRPNRIRMDVKSKPGLLGTVKEVREIGPIREIECVLGDGSKLFVHRPWDAPVSAPGMRVYLTLPHEHIRTLTQGRILLGAIANALPNSEEVLA